jgi:hypothetical protein
MDQLGRVPRVSVSDDEEQILSSENYQTALEAADVAEILPSIAGRYLKTSEATIDYNCLAWAVGNNQKWFDTARFCVGYYWPPGIEREWSKAAIRKIFELYGYIEESLFPHLEEGYEKVAMYANDDGIPTHFSRQLRDGKWTSKLGELIDVQHEDLDCLAGSEGYGKVILILKKQVETK